MGGKYHIANHGISFLPLLSKWKCKVSNLDYFFCLAQPNIIT